LQIMALVAVVTYSLVVTVGIGVLIGKLVGNRVSRRQERQGLDLALHGEHAYGEGSTADTPESADSGDRAAPDITDHLKWAKAPAAAAFKWLP